MRKKMAGLAGMIGPALFTLSFTIHGFLRPGYSPVRNYVSELAIGSSGWIQIVSFLLLGLSVIWLAIGVSAAFPAGRASRAAPLLFLVIGVS